MAVVFYVTGHGFGHAVRQIAIVNALAHLRPDVPIVVRTSVAPWLFSRSVRASVRLEPGPVDTGAIQRGSLDVDIPATLAAAEAFYADDEAWIAREATFLTGRGARLVVADIPPLPIAAARRAGIEAIGISNFTWDWIYEDYDARRLAPGLVEALETHYASATEGWRLPMYGRLRELLDAARPAARRPRRPPAARRRARRARPAAGAAAGAGVARRLRGPRHRPARRRRVAARRGRRRRHFLRRVHAGQRRPPRRRNRDVRTAHPLRGSGRRRRHRRGQAGLRDHLGVRRERHGAALHGLRPLLRVRGAGAGDAALPGGRVHRPGGSAGGTLARRGCRSSRASAAGRGTGRWGDDGGRLAVGPAGSRLPLRRP